MDKERKQNRNAVRGTRESCKRQEGFRIGVHKREKVIDGEDEGKGGAHLGSEGLRNLKDGTGDNEEGPVTALNTLFRPRQGAGLTAVSLHRPRWHPTRIFP